MAATDKAIFLNLLAGSITTRGTSGNNYYKDDNNNPSYRKGPDLLIYKYV